jgi:hypothetical protein
MFPHLKYFVNGAVISSKIDSADATSPNFLGSPESAGCLTAYP